MRALVTGISGMDGSHLAELLLSKGYEVHGLVRRQAVPSYRNIEHLVVAGRVTLHEGDLADAASLEDAVGASRPDEVFNLAAQSHVGSSFRLSEYTTNVTGFGAERLFRAVERYAPDAAVYQASSSEMFGNVIAESGHHGHALSEDSPMRPVSPYGVAKYAAHRTAWWWRKQKRLDISCGILFNHESTRRGQAFVTRKITRGVARLLVDDKATLELGNLDAVRDWGYAPEYVEAMWLMLQQERPDDYVVATGEGHTVKEFVEAALQWSGRADELRPRVKSVASEHRPTEIDVLVGDATKAKRVLGWEAKTRFYHLVDRMMEHDVKEALGG